MKNTLWTFGDSYTAEYYPVGHRIPNNYDKYKEFLGGTLPPVWPTLLSQKLNCNLENLGEGASSNYKIFYNFCKVCDKMEEGDTVLLQWGSPYRFLLVNPDSKMLQSVVPNQSYDEFDQKVLDYIFVNRYDKTWFNEFIYFTNIIDELTKFKKINIFYWSFDNEIINYLENNYNNFDKKKYIRPKSKENVINVISLLADGKSTISEETQNKVNDGHMGQYGHVHQSEYFYKFIIRNVIF